MNGRRGIVLLLVLVIVAMLTLAGLGFSDLMLNERRAAQTSGRQAQARALAQSGVEVARQFLDRELTDQTTAGGLYDNPQRMQSQLVADDPMPQNYGRFSIVAPRIEDNTVTGVRYGLQDESARINLATLLTNKDTKDNAKKILMGLPGMTDELSEAILDWIDANDTPRENGAEAEYYGSLAPPYAPRNGPPVTIDELLLVRGVTPELLFGLDAARMGLTSAAADGVTIAGVDNSDGSMDHGWAAYLTLHSAESNLKADGTDKIDLNGDDLKKIYDALVEVLDQPTAEFIVAYRLDGKGKADGSGKLDTSELGKGSKSIDTMLDLVGAPAAELESPAAPKSKDPNAPPPYKDADAKQPTPKVPNPLTNDSAAMSTYLPKLFANCRAGSPSPGRININQAPRTVLLCIPEMTADVADQIIASRTIDPTTAEEVKKCPAWPLIEGIVPLGQMKRLLPFVTAGGSVYRTQVIGSFDKGSTSARIEAVLDATKRPTRVVFWKDISRLPGGFPVEPTGQ